MKTNWQDPKTSEMRSTHISGLQEAVGKIEESIGISSIAESNIPLTEVFISNDDRCRIFQAPEGKRNWLLSPAPVIKKNGSVISSDFEIDYGGGAIIFTTPISESDVLTADVTYTKKEETDFKTQISNLAGFVGYTEDDIYGVEVDFANRTFTRLAGAVGKTPGADFDSILAFGGRRRCNLADNGTVNAYFGDPGYIEDGSKGQVMVEQPKFYYKVVPLKLERVINGKGYHLRKARYYVSDTKLEGFKVHPAFIQDGVERPFIYLSAYEASVFDVSAEEYLLADEQIVDFTAGSGDKLASIAYAKPTSGATQSGATRNGFRKLAANRGEGWAQAYAATVSVTQLLLIIEYGTMNSQTAIGKGVTDKPSGDVGVNCAEVTGATTNLGNTSGMVEGTDGLVSVTYRGEENFWGNIWTWVDGLNIYNQSDLYVADHGFVNNSSAEPYKDAGITVAKTEGYVSAFGYNEEFDWLFFPSETLGDSALPVGDNFSQTTTLNAWRVTQLGGRWDSSLNAGAFFWTVHNTSSARDRSIGGRLVYVPVFLPHEEAADPHEQYALDTDLEAVQNDLNSHKADYAYQTPIIVGTQIQIQKQSDTKRLYFKLDAALSGGAITISLDEGATSKPLVDIDGVAVTELSKGFVEVVENAVNFTYAPKGASLKEAMIFSAESIDYGGWIYSIISDDTYLYVGGATNQKVYKLNKSNLSKVAESIDYGGTILFITSDDNYLYVGGSGGANNQKVYKLNKSNLSKVAESIDHDGGILSITSDDNYLYVGGATNQKVYKLNKSNLSKVAESIDYGGWIYSITSDDNYLYVGADTPHKVYKLNKSDLSKVAESIDHGVIRSITSDDTYLYVGGDTKKVYKLSKSDLSKVAESIDYGGTILSITADDNYLYVGGFTTQKVYKLNKSNLSKVAESIDYGGGIRSITSDDTYLYMGGDTTNKVYKLNKVAYLYKNLKLVVIGSV